MSLSQLSVNFSDSLLLAQESVAPTGDAAAPAAGDGGRPQMAEPNPLIQFAPILIIGFLFYLFLLRPQQKEQRRRQEFLRDLKKNSRVVTTGGLIGTIADISSDGRFVTLRVDDSTRIRFLRSAIHGELEEKSETTGTTGS